MADKVLRAMILEDAKYSNMIEGEDDAKQHDRTYNATLFLINYAWQNRRLDNFAIREAHRICME